MHESECVQLLIRLISDIELKTANNTKCDFWIYMVTR